MPAEPARPRGRAVVGQDVRQRLHQVGLLPAAAGQLGAQDVEASLKQPAHIREVGLLLLGLAPALTKIIERDLAEPRDEVRVEHLVDPAVALGHYRAPVAVAVLAGWAAVRRGLLSLISPAPPGGSGG